jgi:hypothetical protein
MEDNLISFFEWKTTLFFVNRRFKKSKEKIMEHETVKNKTMVVAPLQVT